MGCWCLDDSGEPRIAKPRVVPYPRIAPPPSVLGDYPEVLFGRGCEERRGIPADGDEARGWPSALRRLGYSCGDIDVAVGGYWGHWKKEKPYNAWQRGMAPRHWYNGLVPDWMEGGLAYGKVSFLSPDFFSKLPDLTNVGTVNISVRVPVSHPEIADFRCKVEDCSVGGNVVHSFAYGRFMHAGLRWHSDGQTRKFELLVVGRQGSQGNAGSLCFRTKGSSDVGIIHLGDGPAVYCATPMMMGVLCQQDKSVLMMEVKGHHTTPAALVTAMVSLSPPLPSDQLQSLVLPAGQPAWSGPLKCPGRGT
ncbi:hypothetical protein HaLaN_15226, partial [Haematococcus lacustris]